MDIEDRAMLPADADLACGPARSTNTMPTTPSGAASSPGRKWPTPSGKRPWRTC